MKRRLLGISLALGLASTLAAYTSVPWAVEGYGFIPTNSAGRVMLSNETASSDGVAWNPCAISMAGNWDLQFVFNFGSNQGLCGGDGMSFMLQSAANNAGSPTTISGPTTGASNNGEKAYTGIPNSLAIAFDVYPDVTSHLNLNSCVNLLVDGHNDGWNSDVAGCGVGSSTVAGPCFPNMSATQLDVRDGLDHAVEISWNSATMVLTLTFDGSVRAAWTLPASYVSSIFGGDSSVVYGVGASTGGAANYQSFAQTNANPSLCQATPTAGPTGTAVVMPTSACVDSPVPTSTLTPTVLPGAVQIPWALNGNARNSAGQVLLVDNGATEASTAWNPCTIPVTGNFDLTFSVYFGQNEEQCGGDGLAFILQNCNVNQLGSDSGEHAYTGMCANSLAIDFDTYQNLAAPYNDPAYNSLQLRTGGAMINASTCGTGLVSGPCRPPISTVNPIVTDGQYHTVEIIWNAAAGSLSVRTDNNPSLSGTWVLPANYVASIFGGNANVYYGWGGSDGGATNYEAFSQLSANPSLGCVATPTLAITPTPINAPTNVCFNTPAPTFTAVGPINTLTPSLTTTPSLTPTQTAGGGAFTVVSATITYAADDYFKFWINGNLVVNGGVFDAGDPPVTVAISVADFSAPGTPNWFAAEDLNSVANIIGCTWLITLTGADGSVAYITAGDSPWTMYDDVTGTSPPPNDGSGNAWYSPAWANPVPATFFNQAPIDTNGISWFNPLHLTNPATGAQIPVLSHSVAGTQSTLSEDLYFREAVVLVGIPATATSSPTALPSSTPSPTQSPSASPSITPVFSATVTPTPYPTACAVLPTLVESTVLGNTGCAGSGNPVGWSYTVPSNPGQILIAQVESTGPTITSATWNGVSMTALVGSPQPISGGGNIYTYYMVNPPAGTFVINFPGASGCSWNPTVSVYKNVNTASPFGTITSTSGIGNSNTSDPITTTYPYSIIHDFYAYPSGPYIFSGITGTQLWAASTSNCCDEVYGSAYNTTGPGLYTLNYPNTGGPNTWTSVTLELRAVNVCGSSTPTPTSFGSPTATWTATSSFTSSPVPSFTITNTSTPSATPSPTASGPAPTAVPTVCGALPAYVESGILGNTGCAGSGNPIGWTYTVPANPGEIMLVQVESTGPVVSSVTWNGVDLAKLPGSPQAISGGGKIYTYYMVDPEPGTFVINFPGASGCSWNPTVSVYKNIDTASPFGAIHAASGSGDNEVVDTITTTSPRSMVHDFYAYPSGPWTYSGITGTQLWAANASNCCDDVYGSFLGTSAPGRYALRYPNTGGPNSWTSQTIELKAAPCEPTPTAITTLPPVADPPPHTIFPYPQPCRGPVLHFAYYMLRPGQANLHIFNAVGVALGGLNEHRDAGPEVGTLNVGGFASGVYYFQMEIRYDAGDREMLKVGKFLILRP